jgi:DNA-binding NtrC family response regulator
VRELQNAIERAVVLTEGNIIESTHLFYRPFTNNEWSFPGTTDNEKLTNSTLESVEREHIIKILEKCNWNKSKTARLLKIDRKTLRLKIEKYEIKPD